MARPKKSSITAETTQRILAAAERSFGERGFAGTRLEDVAAAAGIRRPSLLYHFGSKDLLHDAVVSHAFDALAAALAQGLGADGEYADRVRAVVDALLAFEAGHPRLAQVILRALLDADGPRRARVLAGLRPAIDRMTAFVDHHGDARVAPGLSSAVAVATLFFGHLLRTTLGRDAPAWFGDADATRALSALLLLHRPGASDDAHRS